MNLRVVGAGLPRTGTQSLRVALERLLGGPCYHMSAIPGHPFDLGPEWSRALSGGAPDWERVFAGFSAAVDWPASLFWRELAAAQPDALVLLSLRDGAETWYQSFAATILPHVRQSSAPGWTAGRALVQLVERHARTPRWDDPELLMRAYERHADEVRRAIPARRLLEWRAPDGWAPICRALDLPVPDEPFPWTNRRADWG